LTVIYSSTSDGILPSFLEVHTSESSFTCEDKGFMWVPIFVEMMQFLKDGLAQSDAARVTVF
jgi:hypothetical protein